MAYAYSVDVKDFVKALFLDFYSQLKGAEKALNTSLTNHHVKLIVFENGFKFISERLYCSSLFWSSINSTFSSVLVSTSFWGKYMVQGETANMTK